jgi:aspartyl-tRNA(Asn)/glutamyl-tRNA(Gln) amidotransferase subunit A
LRAHPFAEAYAVHERDLQQRPEDYAEATRRKLLPGAFIAAADYVKAQQLRTQLCREFADAIKEFDAIITLSSLDLPCGSTTPTPSPRPMSVSAGCLST